MIGFLDTVRKYAGGFFGHVPYDEMVLGMTPTGFWKLDESAGPTAADATGNGNDATYHGTVSYRDTGLIVAGSPCAKWDAADDNADSGAVVPHVAALDLAAGGTVVTWLRREDASHFGFLVTKWTTAINGWTVTIENAVDAIGAISTRNAGVAEFLFGTRKLNDDRPHMLALVIDPGKFVRIYVDGIEDAGAQFVNFPGAAADDVYIGSDYEPINFRAWQGKVAIWSGIALTPGQIMDLYVRGTEP